MIDLSNFTEDELDSLEEQLRNRSRRKQYEENLAQIEKNKQYIGKCFVEKGNRYIRILSAKSSNGYRVEAMCFEFPVKYSISGNMTKMFSPDNAFSSIDFNGFYVEDYPLLCNDLFGGFRGKKVIDNLVEITEEEYFSKMDEYLEELKEKMKNGYFDTSKEK